MGLIECFFPLGERVSVKRIPSALPVAVLVAIVTATTVPRMALGQVDAPAPVTLVLDLVPGGAVDAERLRDAIARELGVPVVWQRNSRGGTIAVLQVGPRVVVTFDGPDGRHDGRGIPLAADAGQAERDITLLAGNVARDQAAQFAPPPAPAAPPRPPTPATPPPVAAGPSPQFVGVDFAPGVGVSTVDRGRSIRSFSLGALGALSGGVKGLAVSGVVDISHGPLCGLQVAGVVNVAADSRGAQIAGTVNVAQHLGGVQIAGVVNSSAGDSTGAQVATVNVAGGRLHGVQIGVVNSSAGDSTGAQVATVNVARGPLHGVQIGVVNYAGDADFQLGLVNINASGRFLLDAWANPETGLLLAGVKHGGAHYHWIYGVGDRVADVARPWAALGVGAHMTPSKKLFVDLDLIDELELVFRASSTTTNYYQATTNVYQARVVVGYKLLPQVALFAGPTYNVLVAAPTAPAGAPGYAADLADSSSTIVRGWPSVALGVEGL
jgi:hypothetical protein